MTDARDAYKKVMDLYPTSEPAQWAKDEMKELDKAMEMTAAGQDGSGCGPMPAPTPGPTPAAK